MILTNYTYSQLAENQLLKMAKERTITDETLNKEWYKRFDMSYPYKLSDTDNIIN